MKVCECGACKWRTVFGPESGVINVQCLKCYRWYPKSRFLRLKDKP